jgi:NAD(P)-dependent dehydrogenase (short-subunit alcohol dehydrogenase family)/acyl carrier protein
MLALEMSLDADLGIDSIKRVEILSAMQEKMPDAPHVSPDDLGRLQTLGQVVDYLTTAAPRVAVDNQTESVSQATSNSARHDSAKLEQLLLETVAEKTGYPVDMLVLEMALDADLGVDSIKRVEILSAMQERVPEATVVAPEQLGQLRTLGDVVAAMTAGAMMSPAPSSPSGEPPRTSPSRTAMPSTISQTAPSFDRLEWQTPVLRPLSEDRPRSFKALPGPIWIVGPSDALADALQREWSTRNVVARRFEFSNSEFSAATLSESPGGLIVVAPAALQPSVPEHVLRWLQQFSASSSDKLGRIVACITRLGGGFALDGPLDGDPLAGALGGMFKTAQREWPDARTKWIDLPAAASDTNELARRIVDELLCDGPLEVGFVGGRSHAIVLEPRSFHPAAEAPIRSTDVVVASGGARGVTAEAILALAREWRCKFLLLGRSAEPCVEPAWLAGVEGEAEIKRAIAASSDRRMAPTELQKEYRRWSANREIVANLRRIEAAGGTVVYRSLDVRDRNAAADAIDEARRTLGPIRGLVHGAGVLFDRRIEDQTPEQFAEVLSTKIDALAALLSATEADDLRSIALFSSSTARFGRVGQIAYAAANEAMNKMARRIAIDRPAARVASVNWGPWDGGMVDERLKKLFASEGVGVIDFEQGARLLIAEMSAQVDEPIETVVVGSLDAIQSDPIETAPVAAASHLPGGKFPGERCPDEPIDDEPMHLAFARRLSVDDYPLLRSHVVGRHAVLPMATTIEWLAHGAMHDNPGLVFCGFDDLRIYKGVTLDAGQTASIDIHAGRAQFEGGYERVHVLLRSGSALHAGATILLGAELPSDQPSDQPTPDGPYSQPATSAYSSGRLFHGPLLEAIERVESCDGSGIVGVLRAASTPSEWMPAPMRSSWIADPLALDGGFQLMILWCCELCGAASLPTSAAGYRQFRRSYPADGTTCVVRVVHRREHMAEATIEWLDRRGELVARMDGYQCVIDPSLAAAFAQNELIQRVEA